jgi:hypothetical protein
MLKPAAVRDPLLVTVLAVLCAGLGFGYMMPNHGLLAVPMLGVVANDNDEEPVLEELHYRLEIEYNRQLGGAYITIDGQRRYFYSLQDKLLFTVGQTPGGVEELTPIRDEDLIQVLVGIVKILLPLMDMHRPQQARNLGPNEGVVLNPQIDVLVQYTPTDVVVNINGDRAYRIQRSDVAEVTGIDGKTLRNPEVVGMVMDAALAALMLDGQLRPVATKLDRYTLFASLPSEMRSAGSREEPDPAHTSRPLTRREASELQQIIQEHRAAILAQKPAYSREKKKVVGLLARVGKFRKLADILEGAVVVRAPPRLKAAIKRFQ